MPANLSLLLRCANKLTYIPKKNSLIGKFCLMNAFSELNQCKYIPYLRLDMKTKQKHLLICAVHYVAKETQKTEKKMLLLFLFHDNALKWPVKRKCGLLL